MRRTTSETTRVATSAKTSDNIGDCALTVCSILEVLASSESRKVRRKSNKVPDDRRHGRLGSGSQLAAAGDYIIDAFQDSEL